MAEVKLGRDLHKVTVIESERGWGSKVDEVKYFETREEAQEYVRIFNSKNTAPVAPDWYMYAEYNGIHRA